MARVRSLLGIITMDYDQTVFINQFPLVKFFVYHLIYYRTLSKVYGELKLRDEFWTLTIDAHVLRALINWCMVFGSENEPTHWKRLIKQSEGHAQRFRNGLCRETGLGEDAWREYWASMKSFRDKWAVHRELETFTDPMPNFDTALTVAYHYDSWVRDVISPASFAEPSLKFFAQSLQQSVTPWVNKLLRLTKGHI
jgi:hypothetical protein